MIDSERITELEDEIGARDLGMILALFLDEAADTLAGIETGFDAEGFGRAMHFLRSGALNMGLWGLATAAGTIAEERDIDPMAAADRLREVLSLTREQLVDRCGLDGVTAPRRHRCAKVGSRQSNLGGGHVGDYRDCQVDGFTEAG